MNTEPTILFDGVCNLCNGTVHFIIKRDKKKLIRYAALQSDTGLQLLQQSGLIWKDMQSFVFFESKKVYTRSTAALKVCRYLKAGWPLFYGFIIVPRFIRDGIYNLIARNRYKWFGKREQCMVPSQEIKSRFLD